jgi:hypothetical protein
MISTYFFPLELDDREQIEVNNELLPMAEMMGPHKFRNKIADFVSIRSQYSTSGEDTLTFHERAREAA